MSRRYLLKNALHVAHEDGAPVVRSGHIAIDGSRIAALCGADQ